MELAAKRIDLAGLRVSLDWAKSGQSKISTGISRLDEVIGGIPFGAITELVGAPSSGRTTLMLSTLAAATSRNHLCALVDTSDALDIASAVTAGIALPSLLWVRCAWDVDRSLKVTELLLRSGIFGLVVLDLGDVPNIKRIDTSVWLRFRRIENTSQALLVIGQQSMARSLAGLILEMRKTGSTFSSVNQQDAKNQCPTFGRLLRGLRLEAVQRRPLSPNTRAEFYACLSN